MGRRFADINRAAEIKFAADNLAAYKASVLTRKSPRITGLGTPKIRKSKLVSIRPFSAKVSDANIYLVKRTTAVIDDGVAAPRTPFGVAVFNNYFDETPVETAQTPPKGFIPARANIFVPIAAAAPTYVKSKFTGLHYPKTAGSSNSYPIGRNKGGTAASADDEAETKAVIKGAVLTTTGLVEGTRISFSDERARSV
jgi:hypothetical protein